MAMLLRRFGGRNAPPSEEIAIRRKTRCSYRKTMRVLQKQTAEHAATSQQQQAPQDAATADKEARDKMHKLVFAEIIDTERKYLEDLYTLIIYFVRPLRMKFADNYTAEWKVIQLQFGTVESIFEVNTDFINEVTLKLNGPEPDTALGSTFVSWVEHLHYYGVFCNQQEMTTQKIKEFLKSNSQFRLFISRCKTTTGQKLDIYDYLVKPFQRILKYPLLLRELKKYTDESHPDYGNLYKALELIEKTVDCINKSVSNSENMKKMLAINNSIVGHKHMNLVHTNRRFVMEGNLVKVSAKGKSQTVHCFLFNDMFITCKPKMGSKYQLSGNVLLSKIDVESIENITKELSDPIKVIRKDKVVNDPTQTPAYFFLCCASSEEKNKWLTTFTELKAAEAAQEKAQAEQAAQQQQQQSFPQLLGCERSLSMSSISFDRNSSAARSAAFARAHSPSSFFHPPETLEVGGSRPVPSPPVTAHSRSPSQLTPPPRPHHAPPSSPLPRVPPPRPPPLKSMMAAVSPSPSPPLPQAAEESPAEAAGSHTPSPSTASAEEVDSDPPEENASGAEPESTEVATANEEGEKKSEKEAGDNPEENSDNDTGKGGRGLVRD
eukprot:TRINITY_DN2719_c0_g1_i3.p1 TRINITY_DN2719_c0_g1~~TRINITY_DN2719_c0_g1_i3.p1  ORF type:complete len:619 (+),score=191.79 TRINITY_DN2719_c0_g1_i3:40-1857(+)